VPQTTRNLLKRAVGEVADGLVTFAGWISDDGTREAIRADLGLPAGNPGVPPPNVDSLVQGIKAYREKAQETEDYQAYVDAVRDLKLLFEAIRGNILAVENGDGVMDEAGSEFFRLMTLNYLRLRIPAFYWIGQMLGFIEQSFGTGVIPKPVGKSLATLVHRFDETVKSFYVRTDPDNTEHFLETEEDARRISHSTFIPLAVWLGFIHKHVKFLNQDVAPAQILYGWQAEGGSQTPTADRLARRTLSFLWKGAQDLGAPPDPQPPNPCQPLPEFDPSGVLKEKLLVSMMWVPAEHGARGFFVSFGAGAKAQFRFGENFRFTATINNPDGLDFLLTSWDKAQIGASGDAEVKLAIERVYQPGNPPEVLAFGKHVRLEFTHLSASIGLSASKGFTALASASDCALIIGTGSDPVVHRVTATDYVRLDFDLGLGIAGGKFFIQGGTALEVTLPGSKTVGPVTAQSITLRLVPNTEPGQPDFRFDTLADLILRLGPVTLVANRIGMSGVLEFGEDFSLSFKRPDAIGLSIQSTLISGGGFVSFNPEKQEYSGILDLALGKKITFKAIAILNTRMPDGTPGFSLAALIAVSGFSWPLVLGARITALGGLIGIDRSLNIEALGARLKGGALNSLMFPPDPIANAATILADISAIFPPTRDRNVFVPMIQITWGSKGLVTAEIAVVIEPGAGRIVILGKVNIFSPAKEAAVVEIHLHLFGEINWEEKRLFVRAELVASRIANFALKGGAALLVTWGSEKTLLFSVGGFHPRYEPKVPVSFPRLERVTVPIWNTKTTRVILKAYLAFTSNSFQLGGSVELFVSFGKFSVEGYLSVDMLFQDGQPCFICDIHVKVALKLWGETLFGVDIVGSISGTKPWRAQGKAKFEIWIFDYTVSFDVSSGEPETTPELPSTDVRAQVLQALNDPSNWEAVLPDEIKGLVLLRDQPANGPIPVHPLGSVAIAQRIVPLDVTITRFGNARPSGQSLFSITTVLVDGNDAGSLDPVLDHFARSEFFDMSEDEKLESPAFESMKCGVSVGTPNVTSGPAAQAAMQYDTLVYNGDTGQFERGADVTITDTLLTDLVRTGSAGRRAAEHRSYTSPGRSVRIAAVTYVVASVADQTAKSTHTSYTAAMQALQARPEGPAALQLLMAPKP